MKNENYITHNVNVSKVPKDVKALMIQLSESSNKLKLAKAMRKWVERTTYIHALNYWYYRWFTNEFELFLLNYYSFDEKQKQEGENDG